VGEVADFLAEKGASDAYTWAQKLPDGASKTEAYREVFSEWTRSDPEKASQALQQMSAGDTKDAAITSFTRNYIRDRESNPQDALTWANVISNPAQKLETQIEIAREWNRRDAPAAQAWIGSNLPADAQAKVTQGGEWRGGPPGGGAPQAGAGGTPPRGAGTFGRGGRGR
jgi:hypothetical protein